MHQLTATVLTAVILIPLTTVTLIAPLIKYERIAVSAHCRHTVVLQICCACRSLPQYGKTNLYKHFHLPEGVKIITTNSVLGIYLTSPSLSQYVHAIEINKRLNCTLDVSV